MEPLKFVPGRSFVLNRSAFSHYLSLQYTASPEAIFDDLRKLKPGESFLYSLVDGTLDFFWDPVKLFPPSIEKRFSRSYADAVDQLDHRLVDSVKRWTMSDVPVGISLSGGIDSTLITALMQKNSRN